MPKSLLDLPTPTTLYLDTVHLATDAFDASDLVEHNWTYLVYAQRSRPKSTSLYPAGEYRDRNTGTFVRLRLSSLSIQFSAPRIVYGVNTVPLDTAHAGSIRNHVENTLRRLGIRLLVDDLRPVRVDLFRDYHVPFSLESAIADMSRLYRVKRMTISFHPTWHQCSYVRWQNRNRQLVAYDKSKECSSKNIPASPNTLRLEYRLQNLRSCALAGFKSFQNLFLPRLSQRVFDHVRDALLREADAALLTVDKVSGSFLERFVSIASSKRAPELPVFIAGFLAGDTLVKSFGSTYHIDRFLQSLGLEPHRRASLKKQIDRILSHADTIPRGSGIWQCIRQSPAERSGA